MRCVSNQAFWGTFRAHVGEERYKQTVSLFRGERNEQTLPQMRKRFEAQLAQRLVAMKLVGCHNVASVREYHKAMVLAVEEIFGCEWLTHSAPPPEDLNSKLKARVAALDTEFSRRRLCHPAYAGFVCFCDECRRHH
jgi:hypothetical protein